MTSPILVIFSEFLCNNKAISVEFILKNNN
jgi:hypothetical protein